MKCNNCGAEVAEGMKFCCDCGSPLPQEKKCVSCGATLALKMKFCPECGAPQSEQAAKPKFNAAAFAMGDKNVIAGDVTSNVTNNTTINNTYEAKADAVCHVCGKTISGGEYFTCSKCGEVTCTSCYHSLKKLCHPCFEEKKQGYRDNPVKEVSLDDSTWYSSIQEAIDDAKDGDTIKIKDGEYLEDLKINKKVTLEPFSLRDQPVLVANRRARILVTDDAVFKDIGFRTEKNLGATNEGLLIIKDGKAKFEKCFCNYSEYGVIITREQGTAEINNFTFTNIYAPEIIEFGNDGGINICKGLTFKDSSFTGKSMCICVINSAQVYIENVKFLHCNLQCFIWGFKNSKCLCKNIYAEVCDNQAFVFHDDAIAWISNYFEPKGNKEFLVQGYNNAKILLEDIKETHRCILLQDSSKALINNAKFTSTFQTKWAVAILKNLAECYLFNTTMSAFADDSPSYFRDNRFDYIQGGKVEKYYNFQLNNWWYNLESPSTISEQEYNSMLEEWREMTEIDPTGEKLKSSEQLELDSARKLFYACEGDLSSLLSTAQKIYNAHPASEKVLSLYLPALAASGKTEEALKVIQALSKDVISAYITALDIYLIDGNMNEMERYLEKALTLWPESNTLKCYQAYYYLAMYHKNNDSSFLDKASAANAELKNVSGELELSHQIRLMSLLQKEAGEEVPPYDRDFCKENGLYFRIVANQNLSGVYVEGAASAASVNVPASNDEWDEEVYAKHVLRRQFEGDIDNQIIMSESEIQKFINLYGVDTGDEDYPDEWFSLSLVTDVPKNNDGCVDVFQIEGAGLDLKKVLSGKIPFGTHTNPPISVYRKMAADGLNFKVSWYSNNWGEVGRGRGEAKNGKFWHCMDFQATYEDLIGNEEEFDIGAYLNYIDHIDEYGNRCENDTTRVIVYGDKSSKVDILALPVKQILEKKISDLDWGGDIWKFPDYYSTHDSEEDMEMDEYNEYLRASEIEIDGIPAGYLLDKNGNKILSVKDFDHSVPDEDGNIYYPVRRDELVNDNICTLTPEAEAKWRKKLGL